MTSGGQAGSDALLAPDHPGSGRSLGGALPAAAAGTGCRRLSVVTSGSKPREMASSTFTASARGQLHGGEDLRVHVGASVERVS